MRTSKEVIGLARQNGAKTLEIKFVDELGSTRQFTCRVEPNGDGSENAIDSAAFVLPSQLRAVAPSLHSRLKSKRFSCRPDAEGVSLDSPIVEPDLNGAGDAANSEHPDDVLETQGTPPPRQNHVVVIEQDAVFRKFIRERLEHSGFTVLDVSTGEAGIEALRHWNPAAMLVDMDAPDVNGIEFIQRLQQHSAVPIIALAGQVTPVAPADALNLGASDFVARPINFEELAARLRTAQRRAPISDSGVFRSGSLAVDLTRRLVSVAGRIVNLSLTEYSLLQLLVKHAGSVVSYTQMLQEVWGSEMLDKINYLRVYLVALRKKLETPSEPSLLINERSVGYRLVIR